MRFLDRYLRKYHFWRKLRGLPEPFPLTYQMITKEALKILGETLIVKKPDRFSSGLKEEHF